MPRLKFSALRKELLETLQVLREAGFWLDGPGDVSVRTREGFLISPPDTTDPEPKEGAIVAMDYEGRHPGDRPTPDHSTLHLDLYKARPDIGAAIRSEPMSATALSCLRKDVPAFHHRLALLGGSTLPCAEFARPASPALSAAALDALRDGKACLLANHGLLCVGETLVEAARLSIEAERLCRLFVAARQIGEPIIPDA